MEDKEECISEWLEGCVFGEESGVLWRVFGGMEYRSGDEMDVSDVKEGRFVLGYNVVFVDRFWDKWNEEERGFFGV
ncbi:hypothetical protein [Bacillus altitudinis]|uniref:hypothetical protein n=1 Tax=Bacillus altitudinis TaxID=293387 RepID=UPI0011A47118|nr:hypothetical protein [Bacillus altitudinis]